MHIHRTNFMGDPNVGLHAYASDDYVLIDPLASSRDSIEEALGNVPVHDARIAGTSLPGVFLAGNSKTLLVPSISFPAERSVLEKAGISFSVLETEQTCLGNNICCNDTGAIISTDFSENERQRIEETLGVPAIPMDVAGLKTPGAVIVLNGTRGIIHRDATAEQIAEIERILKVRLTPATANMGTPYLRAAIINNSHGFVVGDASGGPEIVHIDEALGYSGDEQ